MQPGTYVRPHRHRRNGSGTGFEYFLLLDLSAKGPTHGIEIAEDQFHSLVALEADSVIFELKQGPYQPTQDKDFLYGFPQEGTTEAIRQESHRRDLLSDQA